MNHFKKIALQLTTIFFLLLLFSSPILLYALGTHATIDTVAGDGTICGDPSDIDAFGLCGDNGSATNAQLYHPFALTFDKAGNLYIADYWNHRVRKVISPSGIITTVAGSGAYLGDVGDNGSATDASLTFPTGVAVDEAGNIYIAASFNNRIHKVIVATGIITTVAGSGSYCTPMSHCGDNGPAISASLDRPKGLTLDQAGNIYISDTQHNRIRKVIASTGIITTIAGITATGGFNGDNQLATNAQLSSPRGLVFDKEGNLYFADSGNNRIRKIIYPGGIITTVAGITGTGGFNGDNQLATAAQLDYPYDVALDKMDNLYIADRDNNRIRKVISSTGIITTVAGITGTGGFNGDNQVATSSQLYHPANITFDQAGNLYIADNFNHRIRKIKNPLVYNPIILRND